MSHIPLFFQCIYVHSDERGEGGNKKEESEILGGWDGLLYADDLVLSGESEEDLRASVGWFAEVCRRRRLTVSTGKGKVRILNGEEGLE